MTQHQTRPSGERGVALLEFALAAPILVVFAFSTLTIGAFLRDAEMASYVAREAARAGALASLSLPDKSCATLRGRVAESINVIAEQMNLSVEEWEAQVETPNPKTALILGPGKLSLVKVTFKHRLPGLLAISDLEFLNAKVQSTFTLYEACNE